MAVCGVLMAMVAGISTELVAFRPVRAKSVTAVLITSFAFSTLLQNAALLFISPRSRQVPLPDLFTQSVEFAGVIIPVRNLLTIVIAVVLLLAFALLLKKTILGIALRAAASEFRMARMLGVPANLVISLAFAISGFFAGVVGLLWLGRIGVVLPTIGLEPLLVAFIATVVGGMRSLQGLSWGISAGLCRYVLELFSSPGDVTVPRCIHIYFCYPVSGLETRRSDQRPGNRPTHLMEDISC